MFASSAAHPPPAKMGAVAPRTTAVPMPTSSASTV